MDIDKVVQINERAKAALIPVNLNDDLQLLHHIARTMIYAMGECEENFPVPSYPTDGKGYLMPTEQGDELNALADAYQKRWPNADDMLITELVAETRRG